MSAVRDVGLNDLMGRSKLGSYRAKRDFTRTSEPQGTEVSTDSKLFVIHKHDATRLHYDLRLQIGDVLKSWAVPKGPSVDPEERRLAVEVEEHPLEYGSFEGVIPEGQYGAGPTILWDRGTWVPMDDVQKSLGKGTLKFRLFGHKLKGGWTLARLKPKPNDRQPNWLLIKEHDDWSDSESDILEDRPGSVLSGLTVEELLKMSTSKTKPARLRPSTLKGARQDALPTKFPPQLASPIAEPPVGDKWLHEIKYDGYRTVAVLEKGTTRLLTRKGLNWTKRYGRLADAFNDLTAASAAIDGEVVVLDEAGASNFEQLQQALANDDTWRLVFFAFDLMHLNGWDLTGVPLLKRKAQLQKLLQHLDNNSAIQYSDHVTGQGADLYDRVCEMGLEGVVSKRADSSYFKGRSKTWLKAKAMQVANFNIIGFKTSKAAGGLSSLLIADNLEGDWRYAGKVGTGWSIEEADMLLNRLAALARDEEVVTLEKKEPGVTWVEPSLKAAVQFREKTRDHHLRHPVFRGLRETTLTKSKRANTKRLITDEHLASIWVTNPKRRMFGKNGPTKLELAVYYAKVGDYMLPHLMGRLVSLVRSPTGKKDDSFFQRHAFMGMPEEVKTFDDRTGKEKGYIYIEGPRGFVALAQFGVVEFHPWGCRIDKVEKPDQLCLDLDPGDGVTWKHLVEAACAIRDGLTDLNLAPYIKTSGDKGLHIVVPIKRRYSWKQLHGVAGDLATSFAKMDPSTFITSMSKRQRTNRILIDYHRNARSSTTVAPYSLRAQAGLPVSTPISWDDLQALDGPSDLNYVTVPELLRSSGDIWAGLEASACALGTVGKTVS